MFYNIPYELLIMYFKHTLHSLNFEGTEKGYEILAS